MLNEDKIGSRIRKLRIERNLTLNDLAKTTGYTSGYLSKVENSVKAPPVSTLIGLAKALGVDIEAFFSEEKKRISFSLLRKSERLEMGDPAGNLADYAYQPLVSSYPNRKMNPYILTVFKDFQGINNFHHQGEEFLFMLEGRAEFTHGDQTVTLEEGDAIYFDASIPHHGVALDETAKCLITICGEE
jgi:transcriptional regulator with XRE-family HTH domain